MMLIIQAVLAAVCAMAFLDWRKDRKPWQLLCSIYMAGAVVLVGCIGSQGGAL